MSLLGPQLLAFIAVARYKTVHAAAAELHLTQTAVTQRIRGLEKSLKTSLFRRTRKGMLLTTEGEALLRYCHAVRELEGETLAKIKGAGLTAEIELVISAPTSLMQARIVPACLPVMKKFPNLLVQFEVNDLENRHLALRAGRCDFAIVKTEQLAQEMKFKKLAAEKYVLVCSKKWQSRKLTDIIQQERIVDFDPSDQLTFDYLKQYNLFDLAKHSRYFVNRTENLATLVAAGMGYSTLAKEFAEPFVAKGELIILNKNKTHDISPTLAWYDRPETPRYFRAVIDAIS